MARCVHGTLERQRMKRRSGFAHRTSRTNNIESVSRDYLPKADRDILVCYLVSSSGATSS